MTNDADRVLQTIDGMTDEIVEATRRLVQMPSVNPKYPGTDFDSVLGGEGRANRLIAEWYKGMGCEVDVWEEECRRANAVGVLKGTGGGGGKSLILNGHIDTVPVVRHEDWGGSNP